MDKKITPDKLYFKKQLLGLGLMTVFLYIPGLIFCLIIGEEGTILLLLGTCGWALFSLIFIFLVKWWIKNLQYIIKENSVTLYKGILTKIEKNIPNKNVTDFVLYRDLLDRFLGIASIKIQTAGQSTSSTGYEGVLSGILDFNLIHQDLKQKLIKKDVINQSSVNQSELKTDSAVLNDILKELKNINQSLNDN